MGREYRYDYEWDDRYCYPHSNVLRNKLGITDAEKLRIAEREITSLKIARAKIEPVKGNFDLKHLQRIHHYIFSDIYEWAGKLRWVNIAKGNFFCAFPYIEVQTEKLFGRLRTEKYLAAVSKKEMSVRLSYYLSELNVIHPFREGNGRTQRLFIEYLAARNGYFVDFSSVSSEEMILACDAAFHCDYRRMCALMNRIVSRNFRDGDSAAD